MSKNLCLSHVRERTYQGDAPHASLSQDTADTSTQLEAKCVPTPAPPGVQERECGERATVCVAPDDTQ